MDEPPVRSREELLAIGRDLWAAFDEAHGAVEVKSERMVSVAHYPIVNGLSAHALRLGAAALDIFERQDDLVAMPLARACYEHAITACWASESREGVFGMGLEDRRNRKVLSDTMLRSAIDVFVEGAPHVLASEDVEQVETIGGPPARRFEERCNQLTPGGTSAYLFYRFMSMLAHPTPLVLDQYVEEYPQAQAGLRVLSEPRRDTDHEAWLFLTVASMLWASRARDSMDRDHPRRDELRRTARSLGVADILRLSDEARRAEQRAEQDRRRATWKGPRARNRRAPRAKNDKDPNR